MIGVYSLIFVKGDWIRTSLFLCQKKCHLIKNKVFTLTFLREIFSFILLRTLIIEDKCFSFFVSSQDSKFSEVQKRKINDFIKQFTICHELYSLVQKNNLFIAFNFQK